MTPAISIVDLSKTFGQTQALHRVSLTVQPGERIALLGASGSGKSTLLRHVCGLVPANGEAGPIRVNGRLIQDRGRVAADIRAQRAAIAMIFQQFNLVDRLPVMLNVLAGSLHRQPAWRGLLRRFPRHEYARAYQALQQVGIEQCAWQRASTLSGGQQQRAAISRAVVQGASVILADEPIASLDPAAAHRVMESLVTLNEQKGITVMVSLHQVPFAKQYCQRTVALRRGVIVYDGPSTELTNARLETLYGRADLQDEAPAAAARRHPHESPQALAA